MEHPSHTLIHSLGPIFDFVVAALVHKLHCWERVPLLLLLLLLDAVVVGAGAVAAVGLLSYSAKSKDLCGDPAVVLVVAGGVFPVFRVCAKEYGWDGVEELYTVDEDAGTLCSVVAVAAEAAVPAEEVLVTFVTLATAASYLLILSALLGFF